MGAGWTLLQNRRNIGIEKSADMLGVCPRNNLARDFSLAL